MSWKTKSAGSTTRANSFMMDACKPFAGLAGDILARQVPARASRSRSGERIVDHGDGTWSALWASNRARTPHMIGSAPRQNVRRQQVAIPGYTGHVAGRTAFNLHGSTFNEENERATMTFFSGRGRQSQSFSSPDLHQHARPGSSPPSVKQSKKRDNITLSDFGVPNADRPSKGYNVAPTLLGYGGHLPGKIAETVHGARAAETCAMADVLRKYNPLASSDCWMRKGNWPADRQATYKFAPGRSATIAMNDQFPPAEQASATQSNRRLGRTFGMPCAGEHRKKPGDRYLQNALCKGEKSPALMPAAGQPVQSDSMDAERQMLHQFINVTCA